MIGRLEKNVIIARSGVYKYEPQALPGLKVQGVAPDGWESKTYYNVYRPANVVMQAKDKFVKLPLIREHQAIIDGKNFRDYALGWTGDTADIAVLPGSNEIGIQSTVNLIDEEAIRMYDEGFRDVSPLYGASFKWASGKSPDGEDYDIIMDDVIDVNHLAFTKQGRGGPAVAMDSEFNEADHPRAANGQFGSGSGGKNISKPSREYNASKIAPNNITPPHEVRDPDKFDSLVSEMKKSGWVGRPILAVDLGNGQYQGLTGSHRISAAEEAGIDIPVVQITDEDIKNVAERKGLEGEEKEYFMQDLASSLMESSDDEELIDILKSNNLEEAAALMQEELDANYVGDANIPNVETLPQDTVQLDNVDFRTAIDDMVINRAEYTADEISAGVDFLHSLIKDIPDSEEKKILARLIDDFLTVKDAFPNDEAAKVAADSVVSRYDSLNAKEDNMGLFSGKAKDAVPEETPAQEAPAKPEAPAPAPAEQAPAAAPDAPVAPVPAAAMEVAQMPDDVTTLDDAGLRACLNGVIKALKALMPEEAAEPEHQGEAPAPAAADAEEPPVEEKKEGAAGDSVFTMSLKSNSGLSVKAKDFFDYLNRSK